jgi:hypothetical protein
MKKEEYNQIEKEGKKGTIILIVISTMIVIGFLTLKYYYGI